MRFNARYAGLAAALALAAAAIVVPAEGSVPASTTAPAPQYTAAGYLALTTGTNDRIVFDRDPSIAGVEGTQALEVGTGCRLKTAAGNANETLLGIGGAAPGVTGDTASFLSDSLGVAEKKSGTSCYQTNVPGEVLTLTLNKDNVKGPLGPAVAKWAYLDVELKQGARILATATLNGGAPVLFELQSGSSKGLQPLAGVDASKGRVFQCNTTADSGPDAGIKDNCRWPISTVGSDGQDDGIQFDTLVLEAKTGSFSVEGGGDGRVPDATVQAPTVPSQYSGASVFELVQPKTGDLDCGTGSATIEVQGTSPGVTVDRLQNALGTESCEKVPYSLNNGDRFARFLKPLDEQTTAQFVITLTWTSPANAPLPLPVTAADFEAADATTEIPLGWCPNPLFAGDELVGIATPLDPTDPNKPGPGVTDMVGNDFLDGVQFACLGSQVAKVVNGDPDFVQVTEQVYVLGDIYLRKG